MPTSQEKLQNFQSLINQQSLDEWLKVRINEKASHLQSDCDKRALGEQIFEIEYGVWEELCLVAPIYLKYFAAGVGAFLGCAAVGAIMGAITGLLAPILVMIAVIANISNGYGSDGDGFSWAISLYSLETLPYLVLGGAAIGAIIGAAFSLSFIPEGFREARKECSEKRFNFFQEHRNENPVVNATLELFEDPAPAV